MLSSVREKQLISGLKFCHMCKAELPLNRYPKNKAKWDGLHTSCKDCSARDIKNRRKKDPDRFKGYDLKRNFGITLEQKSQMLVSQDNKCAACGSSEPGGQYNTWSVDHNHKTDKIRGLLCTSCNLTLGNAGEDIHRLVALTAYLTKHLERQ